ncbi:uncharacterized protein Z518_09327 [Rhinocladiella mackenziei CBS 650.93]|uniref:Rhinocladiella mackenziei CBS 650.93 unplaced genomic scaffold supercont1.7, whole genome shotgun sequence n=1 Tax=Rhinocladiella mackenziei CBS 650.93 TaxID=1442369 RepID=A0A0D2IED4_9EURO|nr:uncharacterized protein Z518_09327 [Rhinocladiella mackenziei CBS 650.93]KIX01601.1 hypothetical protein Z518_09327 [Rhinocladiella mackenziei CBS 650.93]
MTLKDIYQQFLDLPNPISLSEDASLHYITTLTTISPSGSIVGHLESQNKKVVKVRSAKIVSAVEGNDALAVEVETVLEFISGGGAYLPGLENFVVDKIATIPTTHIVSFDAERKITQIRISWDQASLLKQTEVIGSRGKNWPIVDGKDQIRLIHTSSTAVPAPSSELPTSPHGRSENQSMASSRNVSPSKRRIRDPHTSLDLFSPTTGDENPPLANPNSVAPRASARPPPREMSELFAAGHEDNEPGSPKKAPIGPVIAPKGAGSKKFAPSRLFADDPDEPAAVGYKSHPAKYNHFDLGDADEDDPMQYQEEVAKPKLAVPVRARSDKHQSQWDFSDFSTPAKVPQKVRGQDVVHFSLDSAENDLETPAKQAVGKPRRDNETHFELQDDGISVERHVVAKPRKDAETHFQLKDTATPAPNRTSGRPMSSVGDRMGLYTNNLYGEERDNKPQEKVPLSTITNIASRKNDFDSHWTMADASTAPEKANNENNHVGDNRKKAVQMMDAHWDTYDQSPDQVEKAATQSRQRKGMESHWSLGEEEQSKPDAKPEPQKGFWDF